MIRRINNDWSNYSSKSWSNSFARSRINSSCSCSWFGRTIMSRYSSWFWSWSRSRSWSGSWDFSKL